MPNIQLNQLRVTQAHILNCITPGKTLELNVTQNHTVNGDMGPNLCSVSSTLTITRQNDDPAEPFRIVLDLKSIFTITAALSQQALFNETAQYLQPYIQNNLNQLVAMTGLPPIELPPQATPKFPQQNP